MRILIGVIDHQVLAREVDLKAVDRRNNTVHVELVYSPDCLNGRYISSIYVPLNFILLLNFNSCAIMPYMQSTEDISIHSNVAQ